jgi:hypothetical protein
LRALRHVSFFGLSAKISRPIAPATMPMSATLKAKGFDPAAGHVEEIDDGADQHPVERVGQRPADDRPAEIRAMGRVRPVRAHHRSQAEIASAMTTRIQRVTSGPPAIRPKLMPVL